MRSCWRVLDAPAQEVDTWPIFLQKSCRNFVENAPNRANKNLRAFRLGDCGRAARFSSRKMRIEDSSVPVTQYSMMPVRNASRFTSVRKSSS
jgi:hypothetical protein